MIDKTIRSDGAGDYLTAALWEAGLTVDATDDQRGTAELAEDIGPVTINVSNANSFAIILQAGSSVRWQAATDAPQAGLIEGLAARIVSTGDGVSVATYGVKVLYLMLGVSTGTTNYAWRCTQAADGWEVGYCYVYGSRHASNARRGMRGNYDTSGATSNGGVVHNTVFVGLSRGIWAIDNSFTIINCTLHRANYTQPGSSFGIAKQNNGGGGTQTVICKNTISTGWASTCFQAVTGSFDTGTANCVSSDGSAPGTSPTTNTNPADLFANPSESEEDLRLTEFREWCAGYQGGWAGEGGNTNSWASQSRFTADVDAALFGNYGGQLEATSAGLCLGTFKIRSTLTTVVISWVFRLRTGFAMAASTNFDLFAFFTRGTGGGSAWKGRISESSGVYTYTPITQKPSVNFGTGTTIVVGSEYVVRLTVVLGGSGSLTTHVGPRGGTLTQVDSQSGSFGSQTPDYFSVTRSAMSSGAAGYIDFDALQISTTSHEEPDGVTSPYGDSNAGSFLGSDESGTIGTEDALGETRSSWYVGAFEIPGVSGAISGTSSPSSSATGTLEGAGELAGAAACAAAGAGDLSADAAIVGSATPAGTATGTLEGLGELAGAATCTASASGTPQSGGALVGTAACAATATATWQADAAIAGTAAAAASAAGALVGDGALAGSAGAAATGAGTLVGDGALAGAATCVATTTASLGSEGGLVGAAACVATTTASLAGTGELTGAAACAAIGAGTPRSTVAVARLRTVRAGHVRTEVAGHVRTERAGYVTTRRV